MPKRDTTSFNYGDITWKPSIITFPEETLVFKCLTCGVEVTTRSRLQEYCDGCRKIRRKTQAKKSSARAKKRRAEKRKAAGK